MMLRTMSACLACWLLCGTAQAQDWHVSGNTTVPGNWLGTLNNSRLEMKVFNTTAFRLIPAVPGGTPNVIGGSAYNIAGPNAVASTISGGGAQFNQNIVWDIACTIGGGGKNTAGAPSFSSWYATVGGGTNNVAGNEYTTVAGGASNTASGWFATVGGGSLNLASGDHSATPGGRGNEAAGDYSMAVGSNARANGNGTFVWADSTTPTSGFVGNGNNQFLVRATGGVGVNTNAPSPTASMHVNGLGNSVALFAENAYSAIEGVSTAANGNGVIGTCNTGANAWGVSGASAQGQGVVGRSGPGGLPGGGFPPETGTVGYSNGTTGIGVYGEAADITGVNYGVHGLTNSPNGYAGYFSNTAGGLAGQFLGDVCVTGAINATSAITGFVFSCPSDVRFKQDIVPLSGALATLERVSGVSYNWNRDEFPARAFPDSRQIGVIAQEVRKVLPELVVEGKDGYLSVDYARFTPVLIEAVHELRTEKDTQLAALRAEKDAQISQQQRTINSLIARLDRLENTVSQTRSAHIGSN